MDNGDPGCAYYTNPAAFAELQKIAIAQAKRDSEKASQYPDVKNSKSDNPLELLKHTKEMEGIVKGFGLSAPDPSGRVFSFSVNRNFGSGNWMPLRTTLSVVPGFDDVNGVGDHAMIGSFGHAFYVLKGDSVFKLDTMYLPEARMRGTEIANKIDFTFVSDGPSPQKRRRMGQKVVPPLCQGLCGWLRMSGHRLMRRKLPLFQSEYSGSIVKLGSMTKCITVLS